MNSHKRISYVTMFVTTTILLAGGLFFSHSTAQATDDDPAVPGFKTCDDLQKDFNSQQEYYRTYDPEAGTLTVSAGDASYLIRTDDKDCLDRNPVVNGIVQQVIDLQNENNLSECKGVIASLASLDPKLLDDPKATFDSPKGAVNVPALVNYAEELCKPFGIAVP